MAVKDCYSDYQAVDYNKLYDPIPTKPMISETVTDHNRLEFDPVDDYPIWMDAPPIKNVVSLTLRYREHQTSNAISNARDTLRYGTCETLGQSFIMWGFETYQEFRDHLSIHDKAQVQAVWEEIKYDLRQGSYRYLFWIPKTEQHQTRPGCWAITIDQPQCRSAIVWADDQLRTYHKLKLSKQNNIRMEQK